MVQDNKKEELKEDNYVKKSRRLNKDKKKRHVSAMFYGSFITCMWNAELGQINYCVLWILFC